MGCGSSVQLVSSEPAENAPLKGGARKERKSTRISEEKIFFKDIATDGKDEGAVRSSDRSGW
jgi:hypothetical protein